MVELFLLEVEDARTVIGDGGGELSAFEFVMDLDPAARVGGPMRYRVAVLFKDQRLMYQGGTGMDWVGHFDADVRRGVFGRCVRRT